MFLPKTKYKGGLHTTGTEFKNPVTGESYTGPYFKTYLGESYTGNKPSSDSVLLISQQETKPTGAPKPIKEEYDYLRNNSNEVDLKSTLPVPIYYPRSNRGATLERYFAIDKTNQRVVEVSKDTYLSMKSKEPKYYYPKYVLKTLTWSLTNVSDNRVNAAVAGLDSYLKDPSQFVR